MSEPLCTCGLSWRVRPRRGDVCGRCNKLVLGPARPGALLLQQIEHAPASRRRVAGVVGSHGVDDVERAMRAVRGRRQRHLDDQRPLSEQEERVGFGRAQLQGLIGGEEAKTKARRKRARRAGMPAPAKTPERTAKPGLTDRFIAGPSSNWAKVRANPQARRTRVRKAAA